MTSSSEQNSSQVNDSNLSSHGESIDNLLDVLVDSTSSQASLAPEENKKLLSDNPSSELDSLESEILEVTPELTEQNLANQININSEKEEKIDSKYSNDEEYPDIEVEVETEKDLTLDKAVKYEAFLRQTTDNEADSKVGTEITASEENTIEQYEDILEIDTESASTEELAEAVNTLIPLMVELIKYKIDDSQESILRGVTPIVEKIIEQRTIEEPQKMAGAIAKILPSAITERINLSPEEIAKAIAPELALAIKEQIRLDEDAISEALGSEMGKAIKTQIEVEKDAMVDALYPVIGDTISKYMVEVVREINHKVENTLSPEGFKRKLRARIEGVSEAELILQESIGCQIQAIFLIDKDSGLIIQEVQQSNLGEQGLDSDMLAGMLTAIRSFANDCIVSGSELDSIDYGNWQIHLEVAGYCYLAMVLKGEPNKKFLTVVRHTFGDIVLNYGDAIAKFNGETAAVPQGIKSELQQLIEPQNYQVEKTSSSKTFVWLLIFLLAMILLPWGFVTYRARTAFNIEQATAIQLDATPELSVYRLEPRVKRGELTLKGRVPSKYLRDRASIISQEIATENNLKFNNQVIAVDVPLDPSLLTGEISRLTEVFNQQPEVKIETSYESKSLLIEGFILDQNLEQSIIKSFRRIPGIEQITIKVDNQLPALEEKIFFDSSSDKLNLAQNSSKIKSVIGFLHQYPQLKLNLIAYNDGIGSKQINQKLGTRRCANIKAALIAGGIDSSRLTNDCDSRRISTKQSSTPHKLARYVEFEPFVSNEESL